MSEIPFPHLASRSSSIALVEDDTAYSYSKVNSRIDRFANGLLSAKKDLEEERIAFLIPASFDYVTALHGVWRAGGIAVPLNVASAINELEHYLTCARVTRLIANPEYQESVRALCAKLDVTLSSVDDVLTDKEWTESSTLPKIAPIRRAMMLFTSGTTNKPKGVVSTHQTIHAQITTLVKAWAWTKTDSIPLFLPLHHIHGIINVLCCGLWAGATVHLFPKFQIQALTRQLRARVYTVFMAVPTIYVKLIQHFEIIGVNESVSLRNGFRAMRLNISGSAACPVKLFNEWKQLTGQVLLERYGMTEIGMALSNPYNAERRAGFVGLPLPGVQVQLFDEQDNPIDKEGEAGEIRIKGSNVFLEYWDNPEATKESFKEGWFCTGDVAVIENGYYRILGRSSIDIIKSGGYKLSALEIEGVLLMHDAINEVAVIGVEDEVWGEAVVAVIGLRKGASLNYDDLKSWCTDKMSAYKIPKKIQIVDALPRNAMGKVTKSDLKKLF